MNSTTTLIIFIVAASLIASCSATMETTNGSEIENEVAGGNILEDVSRVEEVLRFITTQHELSVRGCRHAVSVGMALPNRLPATDILPGSSGMSNVALVEVAFTEGSKFEVGVPEMWVYSDGDLVYERTDSLTHINRIGVDIDNISQRFESLIETTFGQTVYGFDRSNCKQMRILLPYWDEASSRLNK